VIDFDIFFKVINFIVFSGFVVFYVKRNLWGSIKTQLLRRKSELEDFYNQDKTARAEYKTLSEQLRYQETVYKSLDEKVLLWRSSIQADHEKRKRECEKFEHDLQSRMRAQMEYWHMISVGRTVVPEAFKMARVELKNFFKDEQHKDAYNERALKLLQRSD
jgi:hypothetical protein